MEPGGWDNQGHWESGFGILVVKMLTQNTWDMGLNPTWFHFSSKQDVRINYYIFLI